MCHRVLSFLTNSSPRGLPTVDGTMSAYEAGACAEAVSGRLEETMEHMADNRAVSARIDRLEQECSKLKRDLREEAQVGDAVWVKGELERLFGGHTVKFDQEAVLHVFPKSDRRIGEKALDRLYHWRDLCDNGMQQPFPGTDNMMRAAGEETTPGPNDARQKKLASLFLALALLSSARKSAWCDLVTERQNVDQLAGKCDRTEPPNWKMEGHLLSAVDRVLQTVEAVRRLHWKELDYLRQQAKALAAGGFSEVGGAGQEANQGKGRPEASEQKKWDQIEEFLFSDVLAMYKTFVGRFGFNNRCIGFLDTIRKTLLVQRDEECEARTTEAWKHEEDKRLSLDDFKATICLPELEKGAQIGLFPPDAIALFLY